MREKLNAGAEVWVVERDEEGIACEVSGYIFLAEVEACLNDFPMCDTKNCPKDREAKV